MKKLSLLVALALLVSFGAFAQVSLDYAVTGNATMTWGIELDDADDGNGQTHGFKYDDSTSMAMTITLDPASVTKGGSGVYGEITLSGFGVAIGKGQGVKWEDAVKTWDDEGNNYATVDPYNANNAFSPKMTTANTENGDKVFKYTFIETGIKVSNPAVAAKIVLSDALFVKIASKPDFDYNYSKTISDKNVAKISADWSGGFTLGYMSDLIDVNANVVSEKDYEDNRWSMYATGIDAKVKAVDGVAIGIAYANTGGTPTKDLALHYVGASIDVTMIPMVAVNFDIDMEMQRDEKTFTNIDLTLPVTLSDSLSVTPRVSFSNETEKFNDGAAEKKAYEGMFDGQLKVALTGDLSLAVTGTFKDILAHDDGVSGDSDSNMTAKLEMSGSYKYALSDTTYVKPGFTSTLDAKLVDAEAEASYDNDDNDTTANVTIAGSADDVWDLAIYVEAGLIDNTVFTLKWSTPQILDLSDYKTDKAGIVTFATKISY
jgi:hypothetical protein